ERGVAQSSGDSRVCTVAVWGARLWGQQAVLAACRPWLPAMRSNQKLWKLSGNTNTAPRPVPELTTPSPPKSCMVMTFNFSSKKNDVSIVKNHVDAI
ncbi:MAG: hypothetical protein ACN6OP_15635, partial [Pseudomonadales bacterium]